MDWERAWNCSATARLLTRARSDNESDGIETSSMMERTFGAPPRESVSETSLTESGVGRVAVTIAGPLVSAWRHSLTGDVLTARSPADIEPSFRGAVDGVASTLRPVATRLNAVRSRLGLFVLALGYTLLVLGVTWYMDQPLYDGAAPYTFTIPHPGLALVVIGLASLPTLWLPLEYRRPSQVVLWWLYPVAYIPVITLHAFVLSEPHLPFALVVAGSFFTLRLSYYLPLVNVREHLSQPVFYRLLVLGSLTLAGLLLAVFGRSLSLAGLSEIYDVRASFRATLQSFGAVFYRVIAYGITWLENVFVPMLIAGPLAGLMPTWVIGIGVSAMLVVYAVGAFKSALFAGVMGVGLYIALHDDGDHLPTYAMLAGPAVLTGLITLDRLGAPPQLLGQGRRLLIIPGYVTAFHVDYFSTNPHTWWAARTWIGLSYPYDAPVANIIGKVYFGRPEQVANAPLWGSDYAAAGLGGVLFVAVLLALALYLLDCAAADLPKRFAGAAVAGMLTGLAYSSPINVFLLGGFGVLVSLLVLMPPSISASGTTRPH